VVLVHAVARIAYRVLIDNVQASWVKLGTAGTTQLLRAGVSDLGGTLMDENISRAAGATHGQALGDADFAAIGAAAGRPVRQRTPLYGPVDEVAGAAVAVAGA
jgi:FO synthase